MLANHPIDPMFLATDLAVAREFYGDRVGLEVVLESDDFVTFRCGGDTRLVVTRSSTGTSEPQTKASWRVTDVAAEVGELRSRGVEVQEYDGPGLKTIDGIADVGFALAAWFTDPHGNAIGLLQIKGGGAN
jgi:catechol-2,3-dioxygenase